MGEYSIKDLEKVSGIKAHTIRIWEQRYNLLSPNRSDSNIRQYSDEDLKTILNVAILRNNGIKISKICELSDKEINKKVLDFCLSSNDKNDEIDRLVIQMVDFDEEEFRKIIYNEINKIGVTKTFAQLVYPFLEKIGVLWQIGSVNPVQEHLMSNLIRNILISETEKLNVPVKSSARKYLLFLPENEWHEIGLLLYHYILKEQGNIVYYLGSSVPLDDLYAAIDNLKPDFTFSCYVNSLHRDDLEKHLNKLADDFPKIRHFVTGYQIVQQDLKLAPNVISIDAVKPD